VSRRRKLVENQVEYFGKVGMSLLGAMIMSPGDPSAFTDDRVGVSLHFVDMVIRNLAQDLFQVR
jgi:hypothetical protein